MQMLCASVVSNLTELMSKNPTKINELRGLGALFLSPGWDASPPQGYKYMYRPAYILLGFHNGLLAPIQGRCLLLSLRIHSAHLGNLPTNTTRFLNGL